MLWTFEGNARARRFYERRGCEREPGVVRYVERGGSRAPEIRYRIPRARVRTGV